MQKIISCIQPHILLWDYFTSTSIYKTISPHFPNISFDSKSLKDRTTLVVRGLAILGATIIIFRWYFGTALGSKKLDLGSKRLDNAKLIQQLAVVNKEVSQLENPSFYDDETCGFIALNRLLQQKGIWELTTIFPRRAVNAQEISQLSTQNLLAMPIVEYMSIVDLISGEQSLQILTTASKTQQYRKMALFFYNGHFGKACSERLHKKIVQQEIRPDISAKADRLFQLHKQKPYSTEAMEELQKTPVYEALDLSRQQTSITLQNKPSNNEDIMMWKKVNTDYLANGCKAPITLDFLTKLNTDLRQPSPPPLGIRRVGQEVFAHDQHVIPGRQVENEMNSFLERLNAEIALCDKGLQNPITLAARVYVLFIAIHPYRDGNGRTGRLLADLVLRRFKLLPVAWSTSSYTDSPIGIDQINNDTISKQTEVVLRGLEKSYELVHSSS